MEGGRVRDVFRRATVFVFLALGWGLLLLPARAGGQAAAVGTPVDEKDGRALLEAIDRVRNFEALDVSCLLTVVTTRADGERDTVEGRYFRRDREDKFTLLVSAPMASMGQGYLQAGDNLWFYDPESRAWSHRTIKDNFQDSKARNDDFTSTTWARDYRVVGKTRGTIKDIAVDILDLEASSRLLPYARLKVWVRSDHALVIKQECYGTSGKLLATYAFPGWQSVQGTWVPTKIFIRDEVLKGESTEISLEKISVGRLEDRYFTKAFLESNSR